MRQVLNLLAAAVFLLLSLGSAGTRIDVSEKLPFFRDFHCRTWQGEIDPADNDLKIVCGLAPWKQLFENVRQPRFEEAREQ